MMISSRGRYALRVMIDLAENSNGGYIPMKEVAERQGISLKYLEKILPVLTKNGLIEGIHGKGGGYKLCRSPEDYTAGEILRLTEGGLEPVSCMECGAEECPRMDNCKTRPMWEGLGKVIGDYLDGIALTSLMNGGLCEDVFGLDGFGI